MGGSTPQFCCLVTTSRRSWHDASAFETTVAFCFETCVSEPHTLRQVRPACPKSVNPTFQTKTDLSMVTPRFTFTRYHHVIPLRWRPPGVAVTRPAQLVSPPLDGLGRNSIRREKERIRPALISGSMGIRATLFLRRISASLVMWPGSF